MDEASCWEFLRSNDIGRLALNADQAPEVFPVNYSLQGDKVVFGASPDSRRPAADGHMMATFQVDGERFDRESGWSVVAVGRLESMTEADQRDVRVYDSAGGEHEAVLCMRVESITCRSIPPRGRWTVADSLWTGRDAGDLLG